MINLYSNAVHWTSTFWTASGAGAGFSPCVFCWSVVSLSLLGSTCQWKIVPPWLSIFRYSDSVLKSYLESSLFTSDDHFTILCPTAAPCRLGYYDSLCVPELRQYNCQMSILMWRNFADLTSSFFLRHFACSLFAACCTSSIPLSQPHRRYLPISHPHYFWSVWTINDYFACCAALRSSALFRNRKSFHP